MKLYAFDLDGTLAESKQPVDERMCQLIQQLLVTKPVVVISGCKYDQMSTQFVRRMHPGSRLENLYLMPTSGASLYEFRNRQWHQIYNNDFSPRERELVEQAFSMFNAHTTKHGPQLEFRGSQITFSALGQHAPYEEKKDWDPDATKRKGMVAMLRQYIPDTFSIRIGGSTSIDVTRAGIDKEFAIKKICEHLDWKEDNIVFVGDALFKGGNDHPVTKTGAKVIQTEGPHETKRIVQSFMY